MPPDAASALWAVASNDHGRSLVIDWQDGSRRETTYIDVGSPSRYERVLAHHLHAGHDPRVGLVPRRDRHLDNLAPSQVLWASIENAVSVRNLNAFRPVPTLLFKKGRTHIAVWWLDRPLPMKANPSEDYLTVANKRLAYALKANSRCADPSWLMPVLPLVDADPSRMYQARDVVGRLRDAPARRIPGSVVG